MIDDPFAPGRSLRRPRSGAWRAIALVLICLVLAFVLAVAFGEPVR